ncbi:Glycosyltransferase involved in cell wall bisynthesis [Ruegeria intermedia]|uniref:Glycosyltransferase involved in cell wall bisynthesis n=1 Tax=Ruegeria intermedia TaxID=996115 RepID=A0A1M4V0W8_9RHOB|nr:glycosyltransferase family 4 protein [Ruegeria intermedia]SHE62641.1 Glycosyltransferase involved in cell wall bisynthesis [Ruegeria intermedia]
MKILHVFYSTLPSTKGGDIRSRDVIESQAAAGLDVLALSSPFQPPAKAGATVEEFGGISYHRSFDETGDLRISEQDKGLKVKMRKAAKLFSFGDVVTDLARREKPDVIHAHSTFFCAFAAHRAARKLGLPLVYEVRSLWEERAMMKVPSLHTRSIARAVRALETRAMRSADHIVVISEGLRRDVIARGIPADRITMIGNGANLSRVTDHSVSVSGKAPSDWVFAYIGSLSDIEGLDLLILAVRKLRVQGWTNPVQLHGDGPAIDDLRAQAAGVAGITFHGRFRPEAAPTIYAAVDVIVNPRRQSSLAEKVTPLKPLEAMAWRKPVISSSVTGMLELVRDGETGFIFDADDAQSLAEALQRLTDRAETVPAVVERAWQFIKNERSWHANAQKYKTLYAQLTGNA